MAVKTILTAVALIALGLSISGTHAVCNSSTFNFSSLEESLLNTSNNSHVLWVTFYPPSDPLPVFIKVTYNFLSPANSSTSYFLTFASIYLIQPPQVFGYTSLLLGHRADARVTSITLDLPAKYACLGNTHENSPTNHLEVLTHRVGLLVHMAFMCV